MVTATESSSTPERQFVRFDIHQRIQHIILMTTFILLLLTGLPLKYYDAAVSQWIMEQFGSLDNMRRVHHIAAYLMLLDCVYHIAYLGYSIVILKRPFPKRMIPTPYDFRDMVLDLGHFLRINKKAPRFDRFSWRDKFDYNAIFWGMPVMATTGFILMNPVWASAYLPEWAIPVAYVAHSDEALLALTWIAIPHLVFAHLAPRVYPLNKSIFTGKITESQFKEDHPKEYERLYGPIEEEEIQSQPREPSQ